MPADAVPLEQRQPQALGIEHLHFAIVVIGKGPPLADLCPSSKLLIGSSRLWSISPSLARLTPAEQREQPSAVEGRVAGGLDPPLFGGEDAVLLTPRPASSEGPLGPSLQSTELLAQNGSSGSNDGGGDRGASCSPHAC